MDLQNDQLKQKVLMHKLAIACFSICLSCSQDGSKIQSNAGQAQSQEALPEGGVAKNKNTPVNSAPSSNSESITSEVLDRFTISIPRAFKIMDAESVEAKYPLKRGEDFRVYTNTSSGVNLTFERTDRRAMPEDLLAIKAVLDKQFNQPGFYIKRSEIKKINGRDFITMELTTPAIDSEIYNLIYITSSMDKLTMSTFNCPLDESHHWMKTAERILNTIEIKS